MLNIDQVKQIQSMEVFIVVGLILSNLPSLLGVNATQEPVQTELHILVLLPYPSEDGNPSWSGGPNVIPAMRLAIDNVHTSGILNGFNLSLLETDCGCNYTNRARINFLDNILYGDKQIVGLIGPGCSASAVAIAPLVTQRNISLVNVHGAGSPQLGEHSRFTNSFGIYGSSKGIVATIIAVIKRYNWNQIAVLYDSSRIFQSSTHDAFIDTITNSNSTANITVMSAAISDNFYHLDKIVERSIRIVLLLAGPEVARKMMCTAYTMNISYPVVQWLIIERSLAEFKKDVSFVYRHSTYNCSKKAMIEKVLNGSVLITYRLANINNNTLSKNGVLSYNEFLHKYNSEIEAINRCNQRNQTIENSAWGSMYYDAVWAMAFALNESRHAGLNLLEYGKDGHRSEAETSILRQAMARTNFEGVSGKISFDETSGFNSRSFDISLVNDSQILHFAYFDGKNYTILVDIDLLEENFPERIHFTPKYVIIILVVISSLLLVLTIFFHVVSCYYRNDYFVRASSFKLNQATFFGCYFLLMAAFLMSINEGVNNISDDGKVILCHTIHFLCSIGFTLLFGAVCAKTWRLFRIFTYVWKEPGKFLSDGCLLLFVLAACIVDIFLNALWITLDRFEIRNSRSGFDGYFVTIEKQCFGKLFILWYLLIYVYNFLFVFVAFLLAVCTKKIRISGFHTKTILKFAYWVFLLMGIAILLQVVFRLDVNLDHIVIFIADYFSLNIAVFLSVYFLFLPPVYPRVFKPILLALRVVKVKARLKQFLCCLKQHNV